VYDVTANFPWGVHWVDHCAGEDHTGCMKESVHGEEMVSPIPCLGVLVE
jgi:predicted heme/steroid binding protein